MAEFNKLMFIIMVQLWGLYFYVFCAEAFDTKSQ